MPRILRFLLPPVALAAALALAATNTAFSIAPPFDGSGGTPAQQRLALPDAKPAAGGGASEVALTAARSPRHRIALRRHSPPHPRRALSERRRVSGTGTSAGSPAIPPGAPAPPGAAGPAPVAAPTPAATGPQPPPVSSVSEPAPGPAPTPAPKPSPGPGPVTSGTPPPAPAPAPEPEPPAEPELPPEPPSPSPPPEPSPGPPPQPEPPLEPSPSPEPSPPPPPPAPAPGTADLTIGIDGGYADWSSTETTYRTQLGAAVTRHEWDPGQAVDAQDDVVLSAASQVHTRIHALLGGNSLGDPIHYREWVVAFIRRYGLGGSFWSEHPELDEARYAMRTFELGNEPYFGSMSASLYADTVRPTLEEVQQLGLPARIVLPSRVYGTDTSWIDTLYQRIPNLNDLFYAFADHPYWYGHDPAQVDAAGPFGRIDVLRERMDELGAGSKPIFITEYGESTADCGGECVSEAVQAEHLRAMLNAAITRTEWKVEMVSVFQLLDRGTGSEDRELQFGLLRQNGTPKPSYAIVHDLIQQYGGQSGMP